MIVSSNTSEISQVLYRCARDIFKEGVEIFAKVFTGELLKQAVNVIEAIARKVMDFTKFVFQKFWPRAEALQDLVEKNFDKLSNVECTRIYGFLGRQRAAIDAVHERFGAYLRRRGIKVEEDSTVMKAAAKDFGRHKDEAQKEYVAATREFEAYFAGLNLDKRESASTVPRPSST